jgi:hypothetical protein
MTLDFVSRYHGRGWSLAEDHLNFTIGRLAGQMGLPRLAFDALALLLVDSKQVLHCLMGVFTSLTCCLLRGGHQSTAQQKIYLKEYIAMWARLHDSPSASVGEFFFVRRLE